MLCFRVSQLKTDLFGPLGGRPGVGQVTEGGEVEVARVAPTELRLGEGWLTPHPTPQTSVEVTV